MYVRLWFEQACLNQKKIMQENAIRRGLCQLLLDKQEQRVTLMPPVSPITHYSSPHHPPYSSWVQSCFIRILGLGQLYAGWDKAALRGSPACPCMRDLKDRHGPSGEVWGTAHCMPEVTKEDSRSSLTTKGRKASQGHRKNSHLDTSILKKTLKIISASVIKDPAQPY